MAHANDVPNVDISAVLSSIALEELLFSQTITVVRSTASVDQTLRVLAKHRILSAPVRSKSAESSLAALTSQKTISETSQAADACWYSGIAVSQTICTSAAMSSLARAAYSSQPCGRAI